MPTTALQKAIPRTELPFPPLESLYSRIHSCAPYSGSGVRPAQYSSKENWPRPFLFDRISPLSFRFPPVEDRTSCLPAFSSVEEIQLMTPSRARLGLTDRTLPPFENAPMLLFINIHSLREAFFRRPSHWALQCCVTYLIPDLIFNKSPSPRAHELRRLRALRSPHPPPLVKSPFLNPLYPPRAQFAVNRSSLFAYGPRA